MAGSDKTLGLHFSLSEGYVKKTNLLHEQLAELATKEKSVFSTPSQTRSVLRERGPEAVRTTLSEPGAL